MEKSIVKLEIGQYLPEFVAFCRMRGESDADTQEHVSGYSLRYEIMLSDFEAEFGKYYNNCIFIDGGIFEIRQLYLEINEVKKNIAKKPTTDIISIPSHRGLLPKTSLSLKLILLTTIRIAR